ILGFQRLVWWPKCTPASSSSFMVSAAIELSSFGWPPIASGGTASAPLLSRASRARAPNLTIVRVNCLLLRRVFPVQAHVLFAQVRRPHAIVPAAEAEVDADRVLRLRHQRPDLLGAGPALEHSLLDEHFVTESDGHLVL